MKRIGAISACLLLFSLMYATPVLAAAPDNDTYTGRSTIGGLPFSQTLDTTDATTDGDDDELNEQCPAPAIDASVWYEFTPSAEQLLIVDVSSSDYSAGVLVATGTPGSWFVESCGPGGTVFYAFPGEIYTILAFDDQEDGSGNGGTLAIFIDVAPPPPEIDITVDPVGTFDPRSGGATISGTVTCSPDADFAFIGVEVSQKVGRFVIRGFSEGSEVFCDGTTQPWSAEVAGESGLFKGGPASVTAFGNACGIFDCGFDQEEAVVRLRR